MTERFTLLTELGRGGMGVVWKARDEETGRMVALKLLRETYAEDPEYLARFERELELAKRIDSVHVVKVLGFGVRQKVPYLALEYIDGPSLHDALVAHGPYAWSEARPLLAQLAQGLADANAAGVIHRDVKPSNVLIAPDGTAKLTDFGIARGLDLTRFTATSTVLGTPAYLAPEGPKDARSDLYSLGIIGYELVTGAVPFKGTSYQEVIVEHIRAAPDLDRLPPEAGPIIGWLLAKDPMDRPQRASELLPVLWGGAAMPTNPAPPTSAATTPNEFPPEPDEPEDTGELNRAPDAYTDASSGDSLVPPEYSAFGPPPARGGHGCLITFLLGLAILLVSVGGCTVVVVPYIQVDRWLQQDLQGKASSVGISFSSGQPTWVIQLEAGHDSPSEASVIACTIVRSDLQGRQLINSQFQLIDSEGSLVADNTTPCP